MHNKAKHRDVFFVVPVAPQKNTRVLAALCDPNATSFYNPKKQ